MKLKVTLTVLSLFGDKDGENIYPSQRELAYRAGVSPKTVNHAMQTAEEKGWIIRTLVDRPNGRGYRSHSYSLTIPGFLADYAMGKHHFWLPKYTEKLVIENDCAIFVKRYAQLKSIDCLWLLSVLRPWVFQLVDRLGVPHKFGLLLTKCG